jgi:hypothetical protein
LANLNSLVTDFVIRTKLTYIHLSYFVLKQIPVIPPERYRTEDLEFIIPRVVELVFVSTDLHAFASDVLTQCDEQTQAEIRMRWESDTGHKPLWDQFIAPFVWDGNRQAIVRAELDAYYAQLHGLTRDELRYILDPKEVFGGDFPSETFRVLKEREEKEFGEYRTRRLVLDAFDKLAETPRFREEMPKRWAAFEIPRVAQSGAS